MKKKLLSALLAGVMLAGLAFSAAAVNEGPDKELLPGQEQDSEMIPSPGIDPTATTDDDEIEVVTDNVVTGGYILEKGTAEPRPLGQIDYPVIKITTTDMSRDSNRKIDAANPAATDKEKSGMMTESGLSYGQNKRVNDTVDRYVGTSSTEDFVGSYEMGLFDKAVTKAESSMDNYRVIQVMDISAIIYELMQLKPSKLKQISKAAISTSKKADWNEFINYYDKAYTIAINKLKQ